jgi:hypothetical protein
MLAHVRLWTLLLLILAFLGTWGAVLAQKPFREYPGVEYSDFAIPADANVPHEWTRARLKYTQYGGGGGFRRFGGGNRWTMDYPRSDRHLLQGIRRLTRIDTRSVEQVVSLDGTDDIYNWPSAYAVEVGHWDLPDQAAAQLREYLLRGGFLMVDDFHGSNARDNEGGINEWELFTESLERVFPNRQVQDIPNSDAIFHTVSDLSDRFQVPGAQYFQTGITYEKGPTGKEPHWRCVRDDQGRIIVAIFHNMDLGDAWEVSDEPRYPEKWASLAYRIAVNYFIYDLSH